MEFVAEKVLAPFLDREERLIWHGRPIQGVIFRSSDFYLVPWSLLWFAGAIYIEWIMLNTPEPFRFPAVCFTAAAFAFVLMGLYIVFGRFIVDSKRRSSTFYGLTSKRILIVSSRLSQGGRSLMLHSLPDVSLSLSTQGRGTIYFGTTDPRYFEMYAGMPWPGLSERLAPRFEQIENVNEVYEKITKAQQEVREASS